MELQRGAMWMVTRNEGKNLPSNSAPAYIAKILAFDLRRGRPHKFGPECLLLAQMRSSDWL
jgi:hypothetical protein